MELLAENLTAVQTHLQELGWLARGERLVNLTPAGPGNMNRVLRARSESRSFILKQAVPYVARYPQIAAPIERLDVEAAFYEAIAPETKLSRHTPGICGYDRKTHLLCLEDLGELGDYTSLYPSQEQPPRSPPQSSAAASRSPATQVPLPELGTWLGALHALPLDDTLRCRFTNRAMRELNHAHIFEIPLQADNGVVPLEGTAELARAFASDRRLKERAAHLGTLYLQAPGNSGRTVLLHGDFYPGSWLRGSSPDEVFIIDPEFAFIGPAEFDLGVWLAHLRLLGSDAAAETAALTAYPYRDRVEEDLIRRFAGMEVIRRLLGVARLPLQADAERYRQWLTMAREEVCA
ncbi:MAG: phosphotransferase [Pseudomonadales bacterium]|nr:phosphotransferase [Pseudomonadales bacterium]